MKPEKNNPKQDACDFPGVQPDIADQEAGKDKVTPEMVRDDTRDLNNNPRQEGE